jgi:hypothetical protein
VCVCVRVFLFRLLWLPLLLRLLLLLFSLLVLHWLTVDGIECYFTLVLGNCVCRGGIPHQFTPLGLKEMDALQKLVLFGEFLRGLRANPPSPQQQPPKPACLPWSVALDAIWVVLRNLIR